MSDKDKSEKKKPFARESNFGNKKKPKGIVHKPYATKVSKSECRLAYMAGENDKKVLCKIGGCHEKTLLGSWLPEFVAEKKQMILGFSGSSFQLGVTELELAKHDKYVRNVKTLSDDLEEEVENVEKIAKLLENVLEKLGKHPDLDKVDYKQTSDLLKTYAIAKKARTDLIREYMKVTNEWLKATGVEAHHAAASGRIKEAERLRGKDDAGRDPMVASDEAEKQASADPFFQV